MIETARWREEVGLSGEVIDGRGRGKPEEAIFAPRRVGADSLRRSSKLGELIKVVGEAAAFRLIEVFGGARVYVPQVPEAGDALATEIGMEAAVRLAQVYGGERLELPNPNSRRSKIIELRRAGLSVDAIARQMGCTRRRVFQVLAEARPGAGKALAPPTAGRLSNTAL